MNEKTNKRVLNEAINSGCKTVAELALYLKMRTNIKTLSQKV